MFSVKNLKKCFSKLIIKTKIIFKNKRDRVFGILVFLAMSLWVTLITLGSKRYADEAYHYKQIKRFFENRFEMADGLTTIPGYHLIISLFTKLLYNDLSILKTRCISLFFASFIILIFYLIAKKINKFDYHRRVFLLIFLPIAFIFYPLLYTDIFSALVVFLAFYLALQKNYKLAALISIFSICVRQNNIIWHIFIWVYFYFYNYGLTFAFLNIRKYLISTLGFLIGIILFIFFLKVNGGIAINDKGSHQAGIYLGNIYFFLSLASVLLGPILIKSLLNSKKIFYNKKIYLAILVSLLISVSFFLNPPPLHGYNFDYRFLRNIFLIFVYNNHFFLNALLIFIGTMSLFFINFKKINYLIYPFIFFYLAPSWLIEERYSIIPFLFILIFRKQLSNKFENFMIIYYISLCLMLLFSIMKLKVFL